MIIWVNKIGIPLENTKSKNFTALRVYARKTYENPQPTKSLTPVSSSTLLADDFIPTPDALKSAPLMEKTYTIEEIADKLGTEMKDCGKIVAAYDNMTKAELDILLHKRPTNKTKKTLWKELVSQEYIKKPRIFTFREAERKIGTRMIVYNGRWYTYRLIRVSHMKYFLHANGKPTTGDKATLYQRQLDM